ncbi:MAG: ChbG/HpnK family deacetylase [Deltaproteobacteria bacterium]|nr:ChbG/HpnK family deacetylase [Deltaproteobacteria bacterium]MBI4223680.1 ChbG/HpnK family deacetylase [Deltaproteobacteria bacterium]
MKQLVVNADDFGLCSEVNRAVIQANQQGILTAASLMIAAPAAKEAVALAKANPKLKVGLHFICVDGFGLLSQKPFSSNLIWAGVRYFFSPAWRRRLKEELTAQMEAYLETGLVCDHLNAHNHFHLHPVVRKIVMNLAQRHKIRKIRWPSPAPLSRALKKKLDAAGLTRNDHTFGLKETGRMTEEAWLKQIPQIRDGMTEAYCHPAVSSSPATEKWLKNYNCVEEFKALVSPRVKGALQEARIRLC